MQNALLAACEGKEALRSIQASRPSNMMKAAAWHPDISQGIPGIIEGLIGFLLNADRTT